MRKKCREVLRKVFYESIIKFRYASGMTQAQTAESLNMDIRSYAEIESGKGCCGAVTLILYLAYSVDDPIEFINEFRTSYENAVKAEN